MNAPDFAAVVDVHGADDCCMFTTTGRRSGDPHRIEIWFGVIDDIVYLISGNGPKAHWFQNAVAEPRVTLEFGEDVLIGTAAPLIDPDQRREVGDVMGAKYGWDGDSSIGLTRQAWCYEVPVLAIGPRSHDVSTVLG
ncbi:MAG: nitroreductase/quinone reductase family protein [Ilumatobacteraceae bacterium]